MGKMPVLVRCDFKHMIAKDNKISTALLILCDYLFQPCMLSVALLRLTHLPPLPSPLLQQAGAGEAAGEPNFCFSYPTWWC